MGRDVERGGAAACAAGEKNRRRGERSAQLERLGRRIQARRLLLQVKLEGLSQRTGLSKSYLSRIENGKKSPPLETLARIARALGTDIHLLLAGEDCGDEPSRYLSVVRAGSSEATERPPCGCGHAYESLAGGNALLRMRPFLLRLPAEFAAAAGAEHEGQEFMYVLRGRVEWDIGGETLVVGPGDSVTLDSRIPHRARALDGEAEALVVLTPWRAHSGAAR